MPSANLNGRSGQAVGDAGIAGVNGTARRLNLRRDHARRMSTTEAVAGQQGADEYRVGSHPAEHHAGGECAEVARSPDRIEVGQRSARKHRAGARRGDLLRLSWYLRTFLQNGPEKTSETRRRFSRCRSEPV